VFPVRYELNLHIYYVERTDRGLFDKRITWSPHVEIIETKAFRTFIRIDFLFKNNRLSANVKRNLLKALIRSVMTDAFPTWELATDTHLLKLQRLQNKVLRTIGNFPRCTPIRDFRPFVRIRVITKLCRQQAEVMQNHENEHIRGIGQGEARHRK
jgi:hypothetical protein